MLTKDALLRRRQKLSTTVSLRTGLLYTASHTGESVGTMMKHGKDFFATDCMPVQL